MRRSKRLNISLYLGLLLIAAALILTGYNMVRQYEADISAEEIVSRIEPEEGNGYYPGMAMPVEKIDGNEYIGTVEFPCLDLKLPVISEWSYDGLMTAPCRYSGSAYDDSLVICGHNYYSHFGPIKNLDLGDQVILRDIKGNMFDYTVSGMEIIQPYDIENMIEGDWDLTLFTCTLGGASRMTVRCVRSETGR